MKKMIPCLAFFLLLVTLAPCLHAAQPAPATQGDLAAQIFAPAGTAATASSADPANGPSDLFMPAPRLACTVTVCIQECNDCPAGHHGICLDRNTCTCGCS